jgi:tetrahydromethanopterin S-methyltransferase subunit G
MNTYLILPNVDKDGIVTKYVEEKGINIPKENILTIDEFNNVKDYPSIIFFVKYDSTRKSHLEIVSNNKLVKGYNVSIDGDDHIYKIDRKLDMPNANDMNAISQRIKNIDRKMDNVEFEEKFSHSIGEKHGVMTNSGSSANLVMMAALKDRFKWEDESEVIVSAVSFPTTVSVIPQNNLSPVFVDSSAASTAFCLSAAD